MALLRRKASEIWEILLAYEACFFVYKHIITQDHNKVKYLKGFLWSFLVIIALLNQEIQEMLLDLKLNAEIILTNQRHTSDIYGVCL